MLVAGREVESPVRAYVRGCPADRLPSQIRRLTKLSSKRYTGPDHLDV